MQGKRRSIKSSKQMKNTGRRSMKKALDSSGKCTAIWQGAAPYGNQNPLGAAAPSLMQPKAVTSPHKCRVGFQATRFLSSNHAAQNHIRRKQGALSMLYLISDTTEYELPLAVADSLCSLAKICNCWPSVLCRALHEHRKTYAFHGIPAKVYKISEEENEDELSEFGPQSPPVIRTMRSEARRSGNYD